MKFTNGYWLMRPGVRAYPCVDVRDVQISPTCVKLYIAPFKVESRGQTLSGPLLTLTFDSPQDGILQASMSHYTGAVDKGPNYPINDEKRQLSVQNTEDKVIISSGKLSATLSKETFEIEYHWGAGAEKRFLTASKPRQMAYMSTDEGPYCRERLHTSVNEQYYGFGEYFTPFVKNGQSIDVWNEDGGTASEQAYKTVPFCISNRGYGLFVNHTEKVSFEVNSEVVSKMQFSVAGESLRYMIVGGDNLADVLGRYTALTGRPALPPAWSYGLWLSTSFCTDYNEETVTSFINGMFDRDIPLSVFHFDCFWMKEYEWCNFTWDADAFPEPEAMLKRLKDRGLKICVWINPYIGQKSPLFAEAAEKGYMIKRADGNPWQWDLWQPGMGIVDFTNPEATAWYQGHLKRLMGQGVDAFKTDFGERIPTDVVYHDGSDPQKMHNFYPYLFNKAVFELLPKDEAVLFARSATAGCQQFPVHWGGDCEATYESMAESLRGGLSLSVCGFGFWSHDIGGFEHTATPDVYKRWVAFGLFSTHSRLHGNISYRVPWMFDEEAVEVLRDFTKLKHSLMPYIYAVSVKAHKQGLPVMRPMVLDFQDDPVCANLDTQYMFGDNFVVAPVFNEEGSTHTYLPPAKGKWTSWFANKQLSGGQFASEKHDYFSLGLWVRPNSVIAVGAKTDTPAYDFADSPTLHVFELDSAEAIVYDTKGAVQLSLSLQRAGNQIKIEIERAQGEFSLLFRNLRVESGEHVEQGTRVVVPAGCKSLSLAVL